ncbi:MAG: alternative ribosome rescue aminoacyl-tRNA hydrolase ArfB [Syntrophaceae bacterium]|nr:aminoacyl-tRNA hydrolase [Deltaproteobacteria bacterium]
MQLVGGFMIKDDELQWEFVRSGGPGGQNVNKVATAVQLKFDIAGSESLPREVRDRLIRLAGRRVTAAGVLIIKAQRFRSQERNRSDALSRLEELVEAALRKPRHRIRTRPTTSSRLERLDQKRRMAAKKGMRHPAPPEE